MNDKYITKILEEFDRKFVKDCGPDVEPIFKDANGSVGPIRRFLATSIQQAVAEAEKKLLRTLLTECDRTENEGGRLLLTNYKLKVKK